jgi:hypothetical protein
VFIKILCWFSIAISISYFSVILNDKVYQLLAHGRWFSPGTPASSTIKTGHHDIAEILLKVVLNTKYQNQIIMKTKVELCLLKS